MAAEGAVGRQPLELSLQRFPLSFCPSSWCFLWEAHFQRLSDRTISRPCPLRLLRKALKGHPIFSAESAETSTETTSVWLLPLPQLWILRAKKPLHALLHLLWLPLIRKGIADYSEASQSQGSVVAQTSWETFGNRFNGTSFEYRDVFFWGFDGDSPIFSMILNRLTKGNGKYNNDCSTQTQVNRLKRIFLPCLESWKWENWYKKICNQSKAHRKSLLLYHRSQYLNPTNVHIIKVCAMN